jgi:7-cyano-7-deazaguanine synthase
MKSSAVVILSGGQDSTTCLFWAKSRYQEVVALSFDYGQKHRLEIEQAKKICEKAGIEHQILRLPLLNELAASSLTREEIAVASGHDDRELPSSFVAGRNLLFVSYAAIFAMGRSIKNIVLGVSETDYSGYPDCRDEFIRSAEKTLRLAMEYDFVIETPLMWLTKADVWELADQLGVIDLIRLETVTCYKGIVGDGCGECIACELRTKGYNEYLSRLRRGHK